MKHRILGFLLLCLAALCSPLAQANDVPVFTPNVVDETGTLSQDDKAAINAAIQTIRQRAGIWGAVLIVERLQGDTIESLAVNALNTWGLGQRGVDNGLLLVLALKDRKSRFEVGYGLEGVITDAVARRALDDELAPRMRQGQFKDAIIASFYSLAFRVSGQEIRESSLPVPAPAPEP